MEISIKKLNDIVSDVMEVYDCLGATYCPCISINDDLTLSVTIAKQYHGTVETIQEGMKVLLENDVRCKILSHTTEEHTFTFRIDLSLG